MALPAAGIEHEYISTSWPGAGERSAAFARALLDVQLDRPERRISAGGELDSSNVGVLASAMAILLDLNPGASTVDIRALTFIDPSGLGALVDFANQLRVVGARLSVAGATPQLRRVFDLVGLSGLVNAE